MKTRNELIKDLKDCRNELCLKCGMYEKKHLGACNGCRWEDEYDEDSCEETE